MTLLDAEVVAGDRCYVTSENKAREAGATRGSIDFFGALPQDDILRDIVQRVQASLSRFFPFGWFLPWGGWLVCSVAHGM